MAEKGNGKVVHLHGTPRTPPRRKPCEIQMFLHCGECLKSIPHGTAPKDWARLNVGWTPKGIQVWCARHEINVVHLDFMGQKVRYA